MFMLKFTLLFLLNYCSNISSQIRTCDDCIQFTQCPEAAEQAIAQRTKETIDLFKRALCGYSYKDQRKLPMVCCNDFTPSPDAIDRHKNVALLPTACGQINGERIVGGEVAGLYEFPWMALIAHKTADGLSFGCGGSVISSRYVLTAAHCVQNKNIPGVRIGEYDIRFKTDCQGIPPNYYCENHTQDIGIEESVVHSDYKIAPTVQNDIALLRLKKQIDFTYKNARPICLPIAKQLRRPLENGERADVAGWGITENHTDSSILMKVNIPILTRESCVEYYNTTQTMHVNILTEEEFCAGEINKDSCSGDSGGPLMLQRIWNNVYSIVQYGVVSRGPRQCGVKNPGIYTDVTKYMDWILDNIKA